MSNVQPALPIVTKDDIEKYLEQVKELICKGKFRIERHKKIQKKCSFI